MRIYDVGIVFSHRLLVWAFSHQNKMVEDITPCLLLMRDVPIQYSMNKKQKDDLEPPHDLELMNDSSSPIARWARLPPSEMNEF